MWVNHRQKRRRESWMTTTRERIGKVAQDANIARSRSGSQDILGEVSSIDSKLLQQLIAEQQREEATNFAYLSETLAGLITSRTPGWLLEMGTQLLGSERSDERILGTRLVRELKSDAVLVTKRLLEVLEDEHDDAVIAWLLNALAFLGRPEALSAISSFAGSASAGVREAVATAISGCSTPDLSQGSRDVLVRLAHDADHQVRFSAVFELGEWWKEKLDVAIQLELDVATRDAEPSVQRVARAALFDDE
jgi:hypothetical protein